MKKRYSVLMLVAVHLLPAFVSAQDASDRTTLKNTPLLQVTDEKEEQEDFPVITPGSISRVNSYTLKGDSNLAVQDTNSLLKQIEAYDIEKKRYHPRPPRVIPENAVLDYPEMSPLFMPLVFNAQRRNFQFTYREKRGYDLQLTTQSLDSLRATLQARRFINRVAQSVLQNAELKLLNVIQYDAKNLPQPEKLVFQLDSRKPAVWVKAELPKAVIKADTKLLPRNRVSPWRKLGYTKFQLTQTYVSPNWSKGGESNMAGLATLYLEADYSDSKNIAFDNFIDIKIGMNTVTSDTLRNLNVSTDQLRAVSKLGIRMYNDWYYTLSAEFNTQFLNNYKQNTWTKMASFLSPAKLFVGLGVDYKKSDRKKGYNFSLLLSPLTVKMNYLQDNKNFKPSNYGIKNGQHFGKELGSKVAANLTWTFSEQVKWTSKIYYYTDFTYVDTDWENTLDLILSNYFTTSIYVHLKADDRIKREPGESLIQMQELLSFGMIYRW